VEQDLPSKEDWELILKNAKQMVFEANERIVVEGESPPPRICQIISGEVRIEKNVRGKVQVMPRRLQSGDIFGELSFLQGGGTSSASVIAETKVELYAIDSYAIRVLSDLKPGLAGRFFKYIASVVRARLLAKLPARQLSQQQSKSQLRASDRSTGSESSGNNAKSNNTNSGNNNAKSNNNNGNGKKKQ
jgi:CRP-like cAMP-binding protein